jgi:hypothetical protein
VPSYYKGNPVIIEAKFNDKVTGAFVDPTNIFIEVKTPLGVRTVYTYGVTSGFIREGLGNYSYEINPTIEGRWAVKTAGTGINQGATETSFIILESEFD